MYKRHLKLQNTEIGFFKIKGYYFEHRNITESPMKRWKIQIFKLFMKQINQKHSFVGLILQTPVVYNTPSLISSHKSR